MKERMQEILDQVVDCDITLIPHRTFLALSAGGTVCICPTTESPCNSSCLFFSVQKPVDKTSNIYRVTISCRATTLFYFADLS